jgi:hypothetical protein
MDRKFSESNRLRWESQLQINRRPEIRRDAKPSDSALAHDLSLLIVQRGLVTAAESRVQILST